jgi:signal transduction histidine kinase
LSVTRALVARRTWSSGDQRLRYAGILAALVAAYYGSAQLGFAFEFAGPVGAIVWLPVGVGIAFLYFAGLQYWPGIVLADLLVNSHSPLPLGTLLGQTFGNLLEVVVATALLKRALQGSTPEGSLRAVSGMLWAIGAGTAISATIGTLSLKLGGGVSMSVMPSVWRTWWLGDFSGALIVVPLALAWRRLPDRTEARRFVIETAIGVAAVVASSVFAFLVSPPLTYVVFPALIVCALRLGQRGATLAVAVASGFALWATTHYTGPFHLHSLTRSVLMTQLFIAVASVSTQCLAAVMTERERFAERLLASRMRLVEAADNERRRLEQNLHDGAQQRLTALIVRLGLASELMADRPAAADEMIQASRTELELAIGELRALAHGSDPPVLAERGLHAAIQDIAARSSIAIEVAALPVARLSRSSEATAYYVIAEAVANAQKYAHASRVWIAAATVGGVVQVEVADDGIGGAVETDGSGLQGLRDRVEALGGAFQVRSPFAGGTRLFASIPLTPGD